MDESFAIPSEGLVISSVLGLKPSLRLLPHKSTQKAHVILRRVEIENDSSEEEDSQSTSSIVHFRLFAQKRFTITPGKEILLTVEDERFKDRAVLFSGTPLTSEELEEIQRSKAVDEGNIPPLPKTALPPKMRRAWRKPDDDATTTSERSSVGIQATPETCSTHVQAQPLLRAVAIQSEPSVASASVQAQDSIPIPYIPPPILSGTRTKERSLSPMDLDSPGSVSTPLSPLTPYPSVLDLPPTPLVLDLPPTPVPLIPGPLSHLLTSPSSKPVLLNDDAADMQISPDSNSFPNLPLLLLSESSTIPMSEQRMNVSVPSQTVLPSPFPQSLPSVDNNMTIATSTEKVSKKSSTYNPFVSAGFETEFTGEARAKKESITDEPKTVTTKSESPTLVESLSDALSPRQSSPDVKSTATSSPVREQTTGSSTATVNDEGKAKEDFSHVIKEPQSVQIKRTPTGPRNAVASSSKVMVEHHSRSISNLPIAPRAPRSLRNMDEESTPTPKALAVISAASFSNPLGIKPSTLPAFTPPAPHAAVTAQTKKKLIIGTGFAKTPAEANLNPSTSRLKGTNLVHYSSPSPPPPNSAPPEPAPTPPPPPTPIQIKWKRLSINTDSNANGKGLLERISPTTSRTSNPLMPKDSPDNFQPNSVSLAAKHSPTISKPTGPKSPPNNPPHPPLISNSPHPPSPLTPLSSPNNSPKHKITTTAIPTSAPRNAALSINPNTLPSVSMAFSAKPSSIPLLQHPLPPKPVGSALPRGNKRNAPSPPPLKDSVLSRGTKRGAPSPPPLNDLALPRGIKRDVPSPPPPTDSVEPIRKYKRVFRWPTLESNHSILLRGGGPNCAITGISFSSDGALLALNCSDKTIRIFDNYARIEMARLSHNARVANVLWLDDDSGVLSLGEDGMISKWTRAGFNHWQWAKVVDIGVTSSSTDADSGMCLAYHKDRIAVSLPTVGVKIWIWMKGSWQLQRPIIRPNVTALIFVDSNTLYGGTADGVLWSCEVPNGTLRACAFLKTKILSIDLNPDKTHVLIACHGICRLIGLHEDQRGKLEQSYSNKEIESLPHGQRNLGAVFTARGQGVLFGDINGCALIWDTQKGSLVYGLDHGVGEVDSGEDEVVSAAVSMEAPKCIVTGTKTGRLCWWSQPATGGPNKKNRVS
ncbi:hypothetical protein BDP27DRAFT_1327490 [Rhodocollybia butyracea]|uniref:Uncharacterized protein n=1 Tax=Rhodocollybia butyracea TaxID=206335 RepID=A0A9P5U718_9AGAR|nr:hypothetical protein BDP27DRAFT_1327490 [Rhodocollybia butyracea]